MNDFELIKEYVTHIIVLCLSAIAGTLSEYNTARGNDEIRFDYVDASITFFTRCFAGFVFGVGANYFLGENSPLYLSVAVGGFLGARGLVAAFDALVKKAGS